MSKKSRLPYISKPSAPPWLRLLPCVLLMLLVGCASVPKPPPVVCPVIPPLPEAAKQRSLPNQSAELQKLLDSLLPSQTTPSTVDKPASLPTR